MLKFEYLSPPGCKSVFRSRSTLRSEEDPLAISRWLPAAQKYTIIKIINWQLHMRLTDCKTNAFRNGKSAFGLFGNWKSIVLLKSLKIPHQNLMFYCFLLMFFNIVLQKIEIFG